MMIKRLLALALPLIGLLAAGCGGGVTGSRPVAELINPALGPEYSSWLVGAASRLATPEEETGYLTLRDDAAAERFIESFWERHNPTPNRPGNALRAAFDARSAEADRLYSESGVIGRRTDRGLIHVLYGPPRKTDHEVSPVRNGPSLEVWFYGEKSPSGLDGKRPAAFYRFVKNGDLTVLYAGRPAAHLSAAPVEPP
jgi:GWxTD domain-containing protein